MAPLEEGCTSKEGTSNTEEMLNVPRSVKPYMHLADLDSALKWAYPTHGSEAYLRNGGTKGTGYQSPEEYGDCKFLCFVPDWPGLSYSGVIRATNRQN